MYNKDLLLRDSPLQSGEYNGSLPELTKWDLASLLRRYCLLCGMAFGPNVEAALTITKDGAELGHVCTSCRDDIFEVEP